jgi:AbrB family looped-hinge helix DNA binding protein
MDTQVKVLQKGKITIPAEIREKLGIKEGSRITLTLAGGKLVMIPEGALPNPTQALSGLARGLATIEPVDQEIKRAAANRIETKISRAEK